MSTFPYRFHGPSPRQDPDRVREAMVNVTPNIHERVLHDKPDAVNGRSTRIGRGVTVVLVRLQHRCDSAELQ